MLFITTIKFSISQFILVDWLLGVVDFSIIFFPFFFKWRIYQILNLGYFLCCRSLIPDLTCFWLSYPWFIPHNLQGLDETFGWCYCRNPLHDRWTFWHKCCRVYGCRCNPNWSASFVISHLKQDTFPLPYKFF